ncbi:MAG TPA: dynamin family protein [Kofleriaceae bacterium]|nr:dynamin family protein [Kofleriaceae bacterium]
MLDDAHNLAKTAVLQRYRELADIADAVGMTTLARDIRVARVPKLSDERFHVVVLGEFNHGKSTFVNALLGLDVLPTGITPTTAAINHVVHAGQPKARVVLRSGDTVDLTPSEIKEWVTVAGGRADDVSHVELGYPSRILEDNVVLVDTPGVNDLNEQRAEVTYGYVPRADAVLFLLDAGQALKDSEREFLSSHMLDGTRDRLIFVLGKMDLLNPDERTAVTQYVKDGVARLAPGAPVFPLSAREWLLRQDPESGMPALLDHLGKFLAGDRARILLDNAAADAARTAAYLEQNLGVRLKAWDLTMEQLEERVAIVRQQLDASKRTLDELHIRIDADAQAIKAHVGADLDAFAQSFVAAIPAQLDAVDADDIKRYLPVFIEDKFKEWASLEGAKLAGLMERLAEEVITITNQNVAAVAQTLAERLGPGDTQVDISVDSFKYDVGIYAIGALGTTLLFVNVLVGGLLTLAAPILAIALKSKVSGDIRQQAKEKAPGAIFHAAAAMKPHFDRCVDEFTGRLRDFVTTAGNSLYKGINEVLERTISERRMRGAEAAELKAATEEQIAQVAALRTGLNELRTDLWRPAPELVADLETEPATETGA